MPLGGVENDFSDAQLAEAITPRLREIFADQLTSIADVRMLAGGASTDARVFTVRGTQREDRRLVIRIDRMRESRPGQAAREAQAMRAAAKQGALVPEVFDWSDGNAQVGAPFLIMGFLQGEALPGRILRGAQFGTARSKLIRQIARSAAATHSVTPSSGLDAIPHTDHFGEVEARYRELHIARPAIELGLSWLHEHQPAGRDPRLVHGDFRLGNLIVGAEGLRGVLDWEFAHWGDPIEDLGFLAVPAWRWGGAGEVAGVGSVEELLREYEYAAGEQVNREEFRWWQVLGVLRWAVGCLLQAQRHLSGNTRSIELVSLGRRAAEQEYDLLRLIRGEPV